MNKGRIIQIVLAAFFILVACKYYSYRRLTGQKMNLLALSKQVNFFYERHLRFPKSKSEYLNFLATDGDEEYKAILESFNFNLMEDSSGRVFFLYSNGMDWDNDHMERIYDIDTCDFLNCAITNGDVMIQKVDLNIASQDFDKSVILEGGTTVSNPMVLKQIRIAFDSCKAVNSKDERLKRSLNSDRIWAEVVFIDGRPARLKTYGPFEPEVLTLLEEKMLNLLKQEPPVQQKTFKVGVPLLL